MNKDRGASGKGLGRQGLVLNGHDHEGCHAHHSLDFDSNGESVVNEAIKYSEWRKDSTSPLKDRKRLEEITVRSMMGSFDGNAGLLSAWWDLDREEWRFEYASCMAGVQHIWWAVHVLDIVVFAIGWLALTEAIMEDVLKPSPKVSNEKKTA